MILINFAHPLSEENAAALQTMTGQPITRTVELPASLDSESPFGPQVRALVEKLELTPREWQTEAFLVILPALNTITAMLLAELDGRMGYLPTIVRLREVAGALPRRWEVAEIIDLQGFREQARALRTG